MRTVVYQEPHPHRARTYSSVAEALRLPTYSCAIEAEARHVVIARKAANALPWLLSAALIAAMLFAPHWWPR